MFGSAAAAVLSAFAVSLAVDDGEAVESLLVSSPLDHAARVVVRAAATRNRAARFTVELSLR